MFRTRCSKSLCAKLGDLQHSDATAPREFLHYHGLTELVTWTCNRLHGDPALRHLDIIQLLSCRLHGGDPETALWEAKDEVLAVLSPTRSSVNTPYQNSKYGVVP